MLPTYETWIIEDNLIPVLTAVGWACDYKFDEDDRVAVLHGVKDVSEADNRWFEYEFRGRCVVSVRVTMETGSCNYTIRLQSDTDFTREFNMVTWLAQCYRIQDF